MNKAFYLVAVIVVIIFIIIGYNALYHEYVGYQNNDEVKTTNIAEKKSVNPDTNNLLRIIKQKDSIIKHQDSMLYKKRIRYKGKDPYLKLLDSFANSK